MHRRFPILPSILFLACLTAPVLSGAAPQAGASVRNDDYGDPLPEGAAFRIGTTRLRTASDYVAPFIHLSFSPDGKFVLASALGEQDVCMYETATGKEVRRFASRNTGPTFALSADGALLAVHDGFVIDLHDTATGRKSRSIRLSTRTFTETRALNFSADGKALILRHWNRGRDSRNDISRWDLATGEKNGGGKTGADAPLALSADTQLVAALGEKDLHISLWQTATGKKIREWNGEGKVPVRDRGLIFSPDGCSLVMAGADAVIREYETATGKEVRNWKIPNKRDNAARSHSRFYFNGVDRLAFSPNGKTLASVDASRNILYLWDGKSGRELHHFDGAIGPVAFSPDGKIVAAGGDDRRIRLWETATGRDRCPFPDPGRITSVHFAPDGRLLAAGSDKPQVRLLDADSGRLRKRYPDYRALEFSPDGKSYLAQRRDGSYSVRDAGAEKERGPFTGRPLGWVPDKNRLLTFDGGLVRVWDTAAGKEARHFELADAKGHFLSASASSDGRMAVILDDNTATIHFFATDTGKELRQLKGICQRLKYQVARGNMGFGSGGSILFPRFAPKGKLLLTGIDPNSFGLWDATTGAWSLRLSCGKFAPHEPLFSPNSDLLALLDTQFDPCLVDTATGRVRQRLTWKGGELFWILRSVNRAFSPDGRLLAAAYDAHTLVLWEAATGRPIHTWPGHGRGDLRQMIFSADSRRLATISGDGTALVWDVMGLSPDGQPPVRKLTLEETKQAWTDLGDADAAKGHRAIWTLVADPARALPLLRQRLHPAQEVEPRRLAKLIADLDSDDFAERESAVRELAKLRELAQPALRAALQGKPSLELRRRVQGLLDELDNAPLSAESLRGLRAVAVQEYVGSEDARQLLGVLAKGAPKARLTQDAKASLARPRSRTAHP